MRGDVHELRAPRRTTGHEQSGARYAVVLQSDDLLLSTVLIAPTSRSARPLMFRPTIMIGAETTQVLVEQTTAVSPESIGALVGHLSLRELAEVNEALRLVLELH